MTKVLITGGAGFIGYHLAKRLSAEDYEVHLVDNLARGVLDDDLKQLVAAPKVRLLQRDLLQSNVFDDLGDDYHYIYHLAAIIGVANVINRPYFVLRDNILMQSNLLSFAKRQTKLRRLLFASTSEVYAGTLQYFTLPLPTPESSPLTVTDLAHPRTSYMLSKIYGEALCQHAGLPFTVIRPHNLYGPRMGMAHVIPELLYRAHHARDNKAFDVFSVEHRRTFCYIADGVEMIKRVAELDAGAGQTLNIGREAPEVTIGQLADKIIKILGKELSVNPQPATPGSPARRCPDMNKTNALSAYTAQVGLDEGIRLTYDWYSTKIFSGKQATAR
jgi:UDP-glucose 4-epimerase